MTTIGDADPASLARTWLEVDPEPSTRAETEQILAASDGDELALRFGGHLEFGTAGLRGRLGAGPMRMNRVLVRLVAAALADHVRADDDPHVVVGYDARHGSADFAGDTARVMIARGVACTVLPRALPTPVLAFAVRHLGATAGVMVTASHNPRDDNGYKVYGRGGALITAPTDQQIAARLHTMPLLSDADLVAEDDPALILADDQLIADYITAITGTLDPRGSRSARVAYTPLHGVGAETLCAAFAVARFAPPVTVDAQTTPDPDFPTAERPNPEESGVLDLLLDLATTQRVDVALANDPDADRLAIAVGDGAGWRVLNGDELGCLLAEHLLSRPSDDDRPALVINTVTSSRLLEKIAGHHGALYSETLTGFKWIMHERHRHEDRRLVLGYEEALGYAVNDAVRDKDGISAALVIAELVSTLADEGRTVLDVFDDLHQRHGVHLSGQRVIRFDQAGPGISAMSAAMDLLRQRPPVELGGHRVNRIADLSTSDTGLPPTNGIVLDLTGARVVVRPSGTEPKMKIYGETIEAAATDLAVARDGAGRRLEDVLDATFALLTVGESN